jgi:hypothetical protein
VSGRMPLACDTRDRVNWSGGASVALGAIRLRSIGSSRRSCRRRGEMPSALTDALMIRRSIELKRQREGRLGVALSGPLRATMAGGPGSSCWTRSGWASEPTVCDPGDRTGFPPWQAVSGLR